MAIPIFTIKNRATFKKIKENGRFIRSQNINIQILSSQNLNERIGVGFTATKRLGKAVCRNKAKRVMRELAKKILINGEINSYYVLIAKSSLLKAPFEQLLEELKYKIK
tara:strand:- start:714 stop:1040 length:327 start_codon:yes stop_codon:yes gene_type:complete